MAMSKYNETESYLYSAVQEATVSPPLYARPQTQSVVEEGSGLL